MRRHAHRLLAYLWLTGLAAACALLGFPDVSAVARSERPARRTHPHAHRAARAPDATHALLTRSRWRLRFDDEFNASGIDVSRWQPNWLGADASAVTHSANQLDLNCVAPDQVSQVHGTLRLAASPQSCQADGHTYRYASGLVNTSASFHFTYGLLEARIDVPAAANHRPANFPAFWAVGYGSERDTGELDVMEVLRGCGPGLAWHFHGPAGAPGQCVALAHPTGWHVFAADWEPGRVTFYYDGVRVGQLTHGITGAPMYLVLNNSIDPTFGGASSAPATMRVDWVRVYQHA